MDEKPQRKRTAWGDGRVAFRAHSAEILAQLARGRPRSSVWREFQDRLGGLSASQFNRYACVLLSNAEDTAPSATIPSLRAPLPTQPPALKEPQGAAEARREEQRKTFHFDPMEAYGKKYV